MYADGKIMFDAGDFPTDLTGSWKYTEHMKDTDGVEYANLYVQNQTISECAPEYLRDDWARVSSKLKAFSRACALSRVDMTGNCIYDVVPERFLADMCEVKNQITSHGLSNYEKPRRYRFLLKTCQLLESISNRRLHIDRRELEVIRQANDVPATAALAAAAPYIRYNQFGTKTGRLTTVPSSFPILTMKKEYRRVVLPDNDKFIELDFNGAEARVVLGILGKTQPDYDIHQYHMDSVFPTGTTRSQAKTAFFAWLYGAKTKEIQKYTPELEKVYDKEAILDKCWDGKQVVTEYRRRILCPDAHHALNYVVQATAAELTILQALKIKHFLDSRQTKTQIACLIHDAVVLDFSNEDEKYLPEINKLMSSTNFGTFKINTSEGLNLGQLRDIK